MKKIFNYSKGFISVKGKCPENMMSSSMKIASMAMQGLLSNPNGITIEDKSVPKTPENIAVAAVMYADALLTELNKRQS